MNKTKVKWLNRQIAKWMAQTGNAKFKEAHPSVQRRAWTALKHWEEQAQRVMGVQERRARARA